MTRPGEIVQVKVDLTNQLANLRRIQLNAWGLIHMLHLFTGVRALSVQAERDWIMTKVWSACMDGLAVGLIFFVLSGLIMLWQRRERRLPGLIVFGLGTLASVFFVVVLRWM